MDFFKVKERVYKGTLEVYPDFNCNHSKDLMIRGRNFYAIWDEKRNIWSTNEYDVQILVDEELYKYANEHHPQSENLSIKTMASFDTGIMTKYRKFLISMPDNAKQLNSRVIFANTLTKKEDYVSKRLSYDLIDTPIPAYDELMSTLYSEEERRKLEWAIGSIISGDSRFIQKFVVLYGEGGSGKSTFLNILHKLFEEYCIFFDAKALTSANTAFGTEIFRSDPLVAIQHDGDLSKIEDNTKLNSIISHEEMAVNEKYKQTYTTRMNCFLFLATNKPVKITDAKSGIIRRLIDVKPTGNHIPSRRYDSLVNKINFELGGIAHHCLEVYKHYGKNYYNGYKAQDMILQTNVFYNFIQDNYFLFKEQNVTTLSQAYTMYKTYCEESFVAYKIPRHIFREELKSYFNSFHSFYRIEGKNARDVYVDFLYEKLDGVNHKMEQEDNDQFFLRFKDSIFDKVCKSYPAQYANQEETPQMRWSDVTTILSDIDTSKLHYVKLPKNHIVIDFDLKDENGEKSIERNLEAASKWPVTYAEYSKSGKGIHLHYIYDGDTTKLERLYSDGIEIKVFTGNSSLRRKLSLCNAEPINHISGGLPLKGDKMIQVNQIQSEIGIRKMILRNLNKEIHPSTKPSIDFIYKILEDAYASGIKYDVSDMKQKILTFAMNSTNNADYCIKLVNQMKFSSKEENISLDDLGDEMVFFDVEVFPNLFVVVFKAEGEGKHPITMINPTPLEIEQLFKFKLVGFNCRRYDNHILYGRYLGYTNQQLYELSQKIINDHGGLFREAYNISYTDIYDFSNVKQSLKKWEIELGGNHRELGYKWDEEVPEDKWDEVAKYCANDVIETEKVFHARKADWIARQALAKLSDGSVNDTTNQLATKLIFGNEKHPNLVYTELSTIFPGYELRNEVSEDGKSHLSNWYRGVDVGFGGYVYAVHGVYYNVALLDIASMHPTSLILLNYFGDYTPKFKDILEARLLIKHGKYDEARKIMGGRLAPFLEDETQTEALAYALKIVLNSQYGLTSSKFDLPQVDRRNVNNIVALRGALFMKTLQDEVTNKGYDVIHIKTDSIKIANADKEIIDFCFKFAESYGYTFEHEATFEKMCLITDADYIAKYEWAEKIKNIGKWTATGAQFAHPYVFKTLFSREDIEFKDLCETKSVKTALYLDMNESLPPGEHDYHFVGRVGQFCPIQAGRGAGELLSLRGDKYSYVTGTKGYRWLESSLVQDMRRESDIDMTYFTSMSDEMYNRIAEYTDPEIFCSNNPVKEEVELYSPTEKDIPYTMMECGNPSCNGCPNLKQDKYHSDCEAEFDNTDYIIMKGE